MGWQEFVGDAGACVSLEHFGASAPTTGSSSSSSASPPSHVVAAAKASLARVGKITGTDHRRLTSADQEHDNDDGWQNSPTPASPSGSTTSPVSG